LLYNLGLNYNNLIRNFIYDTHGEFTISSSIFWTNKND
jgi:hypothetical protein